MPNAHPLVGRGGPLPPPEGPWVLHALARRAAYRDDEGRALGEGKAPPCSGVPMEYRACPYDDSRRGHRLPMNVSALRQVRRHLRGAVGELAFLRALYLARFPRPALRAVHLWQMGQLSDAVSGFLLLRRRDAMPSGTFPARLAAMAKLVFGINLTTHVLSIEALRSGAPEGELDAEALLRHADAHGQLIGPSEVCAAPPGLIREMLALLLRGSPVSEAKPLLARLLGEPPLLFLRFACHAANLRALGVLVHLLRRSLFADLLRALEARASPGAAGAALRAAVERGLAAEVINVAETSEAQVQALALQAAAMPTGARGELFARFLERLLLPDGAPAVRAAFLGLERLFEPLRARDEAAACAFVRAAAPTLDRGEQAGVARALLVELRLEQRVLGVLEALEAEIAGALEQPARPVRDLDLEPAVGFTLRGVFEDALGWAFEVAPAGACALAGGARLELMRV